MAFSLIGLLIIIMAGYSIFAVNESSNGFTDYREMARDNNLASSIETHMLSARGSVKDYLSSKSQKDVKAFKDFLNKTRKLVNTAKEEIQNPKRAPMVEKTSELLDEYEKYFTQVVEITTKRDSIKENIIDINGKKAEQTLTLLVQSANKNKNFSMLYNSSTALRSLLIARLYTTSFLTTNDKKDLKRVNEEFEKLENFLGNLKSNINDSKEISLLNKVIGFATKYNNGVKEIYQIIVEKNNLVNDKLIVFGNEIAQLSEKVKVSLKNDQDTIGPKVAQLNDNTKLTIEIISIIIFILIVAISIYVPRDISSLISKFQEGLLNFFKYLNREIKDVNPIDIYSKNEIGIMAQVVNANITKTKAGIEEDRKVINDTIGVLSEFEQGDLCQRVQTSSSNPALQELTSLLNKMADNVEKNIDNVLGVLEEFSNYNYMNKVDSDHLKEHLLKLANGVNELGDAITQMLVENKQNGLTLDKSSDILLENVEILNTNSNEAAAALEETAAALEEITSNIVSNTDNVVKMGNYANELTQSAKEGEKLAQETTVSMDEINEQVNSINEAITVIDQIAFQTNILSLNAAVEAATAGEAGKGFAVVAQEVRNLAARSAEAAKEIKELVETATTKANSGKSIADKMIKGYNGLNDNISKTIEIISDVEMASKEQQTGIEQINDAVTQLDQQTQQNALIATQTYEEATKTDEMAKLIVSSADEKEFEGKNSVEIKTVKKNKVENKKSEQKIEKESKKTFVEKNDDEQWESF
jgi:methyl-accepting chemotaxis protein